MNIDMGALHAIVVERGISFDDLLEDVKAAVLSAYRHTEGHQPEAHIEIDRKTGAVQVFAREVDEDGVAAFVELLPDRIDGRALRHVVELRHPKAPTNGFIDLLRRRGVALVVDDNRADFEITANFIYAHLRRCTLEEPTGYPPDALDAWAQRLRERSARAECDCFVYFISGAKVRAPAAAQALLQRLTLAA